MACSSIQITAIAKECKNLTGGIKEVYIIKKEDVTSVGLDATVGQITGITVASGKTFAKWEFNPQTANMASNGNVDAAAGTYFIQTDLTLQFSKMESVKRLAIQAATFEDTIVVVKDNNYQLFYLGYDNPVNSTAVTGASGTAYGDLNGYTITLTDISNELPFTINMDASALSAIGID